MPGPQRQFYAAARDKSGAPHTGFGILTALPETHHFGLHAQPQPGVPGYLLGVEFVELGLRAVSTPQAQDLGLGTVGHVDELLVPPALVYSPDVTA